MHRLPLLAIALAAALPLCGCGLLRREPKPVEGTDSSPEGPTYLIGLIEMVNPDQRFALIRTEGKMNVPAGHAIFALDATGARSKLKVSPESKPPFITADIIEGQPRTGNLVGYQPKAQGMTAAPAANPAVPEGAPPLLPQPQQPLAVDPSAAQPSAPPPFSPIPQQPAAPPAAAPPSAPFSPAGTSGLPPVIR